MRAACYLPGDFWDEIIKRWDPIDLCNRKHGFIRYSVPKGKGLVSLGYRTVLPLINRLERMDAFFKCRNSLRTGSAVYCSRDVSSGNETK